MQLDRKEEEEKKEKEKERAMKQLSHLLGLKLLRLCFVPFRAYLPQHLKFLVSVGHKRKEHQRTTAAQTSRGGGKKNFKKKNTKGKQSGTQFILDG